MKRIIKFRAWDGVKIIKSDEWPNLMGFFGTRGADEILMQFTGLHDKNGKEIYEGDIIRHRKLVRFGDGTKYGIAELVADDNPREVKYEGCGFTPLAGWIESANEDLEWEVIGNVWENPDLLTDKGV